ncbi:unnamed protein product, partial [Brassica rapa subsp. narinosa]
KKGENLTFSFFFSVNVLFFWSEKFLCQCSDVLRNLSKSSHKIKHKINRLLDEMLSLEKQRPQSSSSEEIGTNDENQAWTIGNHRGISRCE